MKKIYVGIFFILCTFSAVAQDVTAAEEERCREAVVKMIEIAQEALLSPQSRPERTEKRRVLVEDWVWRLDSGDSPCQIYIAIQKAATTF